MARTSRKYVIEEEKDNTFRVGGYIRLSAIKSDEPNSSIESQKLIIENFIKDKPDMILEKLYIDENVSGSTFKRQAFEEMIKDIESGKINCIACKDLSRFSRNFLGTGYYIEMYFPVKEVRFIAITDEFDTAHDIYATDDAGNLIKDFRVKSMLDEAVTHDISKKVSTNLNELAKQGLFIAPRAPFGYKKINKHKLGIDPMAAIVVKKIFKLASENVGITEIARTLSEEKVLTPMEYATSNGAKGNYNTGNGKWSTRTIKDILTNITYAGHLCQGKDKITVLNTHDAVITQDLFDKVQRIINPAKAVSTVSTFSKVAVDNPLRGKVICGCCGGKMQRRKGTGNADWNFFTCITNNRQGIGSCEGMYIRESAVYTKIRNDITEFITNNANIIKRMSAQKQELRKTMYELHQKDVEVNSFKRSCYEKVCLGEMSAEEYRKTVDAQTDNTEAIAEIECKINEMDNLCENYNLCIKVIDDKNLFHEYVEFYVNVFQIFQKNILVKSQDNTLFK